MVKIANRLILLAGALLSGCCGHADPYMEYIAEEWFLNGLQEQMPQGRTYRYVSYCDKKAYRYCPYFVVDFLSQNVDHQIEREKRDPTTYQPAMRLLFYNKTWDADIVEKIASRVKPSESAPDYFDETEMLVILKSTDSPHHGLEDDDRAGEQQEVLEECLKQYCSTLK